MGDRPNGAWPPERIASLIEHLKRPGITQAEMIEAFGFRSGDHLHSTCSRLRSNGHKIPLAPRKNKPLPVAPLLNVEWVEPPAAIVEKEPSWHAAPPRKLPNLEQGIDIAIFWLLNWGVPVTWHQTRVGDYAMIGSARVSVAGVVERYFEERRKRVSAQPA